MAVAEIADIARTQGTKVALCGGLAMAYYGSDRLTQDVDVLVENELDLIAKTELEFDGRACGFSCKTDSGVDVDMIAIDAIDDHEKLYVEALDRAVKVQGLPIPVVRPEYLVALKMLAMREKDELDIDYLLMNVPLNVTFLRDILKRTLGSYARKDFDLRWEEAEWKKERLARGR